MIDLFKILYLSQINFFKFPFGQFPHDLLIFLFLYSSTADAILVILIYVITF